MTSHFRETVFIFYILLYYTCICKFLRRFKRKWHKHTKSTTRRAKNAPDKSPVWLPAGYKSKTIVGSAVARSRGRRCWGDRLATLPPVFQSIGRRHGNDATTAPRGLHLGGGAATARPRWRTRCFIVVFTRLPGTANFRGGGRPGGFGN